MGHQSYDDVVVKSPNDRRLYRILHLDNGLSAILVHDPEIYAEGEAPRKADAEGRQVDSDGDVLIEDGEDEESESDDDEEFLDENENEDEDDDDDDDDDDEEEEEEEDDDDDEKEGAEEDKDGDPSSSKRRKEATSTKKAAAAMCVGMGSFSDPPMAQGLAHFLEHMLFMGSTEFPDENEYDRYLSKHGGSSNAYTEAEYTCYHFEVNREYLYGALRRFSQFFISPLVKAEAMEREVLAVDSEFNQVLQSDSCRLLQLLCHTSTPGHTFNRFFWGNKKSLVDAMEKGINLREEIMKMYIENYHGGNMKLVVIGGESLDILEKWVVELFKDVKAGVPLRMTFPFNMPIWKPGKIYRLEAVKDIHVMDLTWTLPCLHKEYLKKPEDYLAHVMGHEGKGSLLYFLKARGWASSLSAGVGDEGMRRSSVAYIFVMSIYLTDSGLEKLYDVIGFVYQYIKLLRQSAPQEWVFKELQDIGKMEFRFAEEQPQDDYAAGLAENMLFYSEENFIYGEYAFEEWDSKLVEYVLSFFTPENMRIDILTKFFDKSSDAIQSEPWFGSRYIEEDITPSLLWSNPLTIDPSLHFPLKNEFIPSDFSLRNTNLSKPPPSASHPRCIVDKSYMKLWYKIDTTFNFPRANTYFSITVKDGCSSLKNSVLTELFANLLKDELNEILYQAGIAKLDTSLSIVGDKLELKLYGFNDKLSVLLSEILTLSKSFSAKFDRFKVIKEDMERKYRNMNMKPLNHSTYLRLQILREKFWDVNDKLSCLLNLSLSDLEEFIPMLLSQMYIEGLCHGNLSEEEAIKISNILTNAFSVPPLPKELRHQERVIQFAPSSSFIRSVHVKNELEVNSVVELYFQIEQDIGNKATRLRVIADFFSNIIEEPYFNQLRTKEQLGYVVDCGPRMTYRVLGFCFRVQSSKYSPVYLHNRINHFISCFEELLDRLNDESFESHRSGLIADKLEKDPSLVHETGRIWDQIVDKRYLFDMLKVEAEELKTIQKSDIINWYKTYLRQPSPKCRQLAVYVWGCNTDMNDEKEMPQKLGDVIEDLNNLKSSSEFYSSLC